MIRILVKYKNGATYVEKFRSYNNFERFLKANEYRIEWIEFLKEEK